MNNRATFIQINRVFSLTFFLWIILWPGSVNSYSNDEYLTFSYWKTTTDFFDENNRQYSPVSSSLGYGFELSSSWSFDLSYEKSKGSGEWLSHKLLKQSFYESGESESNSYSVGLSWIPKDHGISFSYSSLDYDESSTTYLPFLVETVMSKNDVYSVSYIGRWNSDNFDAGGSLENLLSDNQDELELSWSIGFQSFDANTEIVELPNTDPPVRIDVNLNQKSLSAFVDLEVNYLILSQKINYSPYLNLGWNWGLDTSGEEYILLSRGERTLSFEQSGSRFNSQIRTPDSGQFSFGLKFIWNTGTTDGDSSDGLDWITDICYTGSINTEIESSAVRLSFTAYF